MIEIDKYLKVLYEFVRQQQKLNKMKEFANIILKEKYELCQDKEGNIYKIQDLLYSYILENENKEMLENFLDTYKTIQKEKQND